MKIKISFWIKFEHTPPERWYRESFEQLWHDLKEFMLRNPNVKLEWMISE